MARIRRTFEVHDGLEPRVLTLAGRDAWALQCLIDAGAHGCTPIDHPGPRWSGYVHKLRHRYGIAIETIDEPHGPPFTGTHARYVLRTRVQLASPGNERRAA